MNLSDMIAAAQTRHAKAVANVEADRARRQQETIEHFHKSLIDLFGDLVTMLAMATQHTGYESAVACFSHEDRPYRLSHGRHCWYLTRMDERGENDERELPSTEVYARYRNDLNANQDALLLALVDLAAQPTLPPLPPISEQPPIDAPEPTTEKRLLAVLREFVRAEVDHILVGNQLY